MKSAWKAWAWRVGKALLVLVILGAVGRQFYGDLTRLDPTQLQLRPGWLAVSALCYLGGLALSAWFWHHLLYVFGQRPHLTAALRGYFLGHLGKYVPGKAWALLLRGGCVAGPDVRFGVAIVSSFYEVLTTMAAGGLVAAVIFGLDPPHVPGLEWHPAWTGVILLALCGVPLLPGVFNFAVIRVARRLERGGTPTVPRLRLRTLALGLAATAVGWGLLGAGVWALLQGALAAPPSWDASTWARCTGAIGLAYVAGFLALLWPGGLGVREYFLLHLLAFAGPAAVVAAAVLLLRLVWTAAELVAAAALLLLKPRDESSSPGGSLQEPPGLEDSSRGLQTSVPRP